MEELLKKLVESELLTEETAGKVKEAYSSKLSETRRLEAEKVRKGLSEKYDNDHRRLMAACDAMIEDRLNAELTEYKSEFERLRKLTSKATKAIAESDRKAELKMMKKVKVLESMLDESVSKEMKDFKENQYAQREATVKTLRELKENAVTDREAMIKRTAAVLESIVDNQFGNKITELEEDIKAARRNNFGRKIFEAFMYEMRESFFNEDAEAKKLRVKLQRLNRELKEERKARVTESKQFRNQLVESKNKLRETAERGKRSQLMEELLSKISDPKKKRSMKELLDVTDTKNLRETFKRYTRSFSEVQKKPSRKGKTNLNEARRWALRTGSAPKEVTGDADEADFIKSIQRRAGLSQ